MPYIVAQFLYVARKGRDVTRKNCVVLAFKRPKALNVNPKNSILEIHPALGLNDALELDGYLHCGARV